jgi:transcriptional regulator with PAS, ATPase and Fis domain
VGSENGREVQLAFEPAPDLESVATVNAVLTLLRAVKELERAATEREERATLWPIDELPTESDGVVILGHMKEMMSYAKKVANANLGVLITGESGTGKELIARAVHRESNRSSKPFIPFNCAAVPKDMLEGQLFGHRKGAFTGADRDNPGVIRSARGGTLFLDEIGELSLDLQPKLLRFLESGEICPLGESTPFTVDVRVVSATNAALEALVKTGRFREDLFYRLNIIRIPLRPLRERRDEIPSLVSQFALRAAEEFRKSHVRLAEETLERLILYSWPGNVRQLQNEVRRMVALAEPHSLIPPDALSDDIVQTTRPVMTTRGTNAQAPPAVPNEKLNVVLSRVEREMITLALREHHGRVDAAARALGISRKGLYLKRQRLGL